MFGLRLEGKFENLQESRFFSKKKINKVEYFICHEFHEFSQIKKR